MIKKQLTFIVMFFLITTILFAQEKNIEIKDSLSSRISSSNSIDGVNAQNDEITFKNETGNAIISITDEGSNVGSITLPSGSTPTQTTNKLYNEGGTLKFNGSSLGGGSGAIKIDDLTDAKYDDGSLFLGINSGFYDDGSNSNTAVGTRALYSNISGAGNTATGHLSLYFNTTGVQNTAHGNMALYSNVSGWGNTAIGLNSLYSNTTGQLNTANGNNSLYFNTTGNDNTATGYFALHDNSTGIQNTANGTSSLQANTTGWGNSATGYFALQENTTGYQNTANGSNSLYTNTVGRNNTANGFQSLYLNTGGYNNTADGYRAMYNNTTGKYNAANGSSSLYFNTTGDYNTANGKTSLNQNTTGSFNVGIGTDANFHNQEGSNNTILGYQAGRGSDANGSHNKSGNIFIGYQAGYDETNSNKLYIENTSSSTPLIWGNFSNDKVTIHGKLGISTKLSTSKIDIAGSNGYNQFRLRDSYTPTSSVDTNGEIGDTAWDNNYLYIKTNSGWKRTLLSSF